MALEYIFPDHTKRNRKIAIVVEVVMAVLALIAIFWAIYYWQSTAAQPVVQDSVIEDPMEEKRRILQEPNPIVVLTEEEVARKEEILKEPNPVIELTPEQIEARRSYFENI